MKPCLQGELMRQVEAIGDEVIDSPERRFPSLSNEPYLVRGIGQRIGDNDNPNAVQLGLFKYLNEPH